MDCYNVCLRFCTLSSLPCCWSFWTLKWSSRHELEYGVNKKVLLQFV
jgi:hypothetical protein